MDAIAPYYKSLTALLVPFLTAIGAALLDSSEDGSTITTSEWIGAVVIGLVAGGAVFAAPRNRYPDEQQANLKAANS
jgi:hypothetical protein